MSKNRIKDGKPVLMNTPFPEDTVEVGGLPLSYFDAGKGQPLVFVHGWSLEYRTWQLQLDAFCQKYRVIAYNFRGSGTSGGGDTPYSFDDLVAELDGFLSIVVGKRPCLLVGHSLGAALVVHYLAEHPDRCRGVVAADVGVAAHGIGRVSDLFQAHSFESATRLFGLNATTKPISHLLWSPEFMQANPLLMAMAAAQYQTNSPASLIHSYSAYAQRPNVDDKLRHVQTPTLVLRGSKDRSVSLSAMQELQRSIPGSEFETIEDSGHMVYMEKPDEFNAKVARFIEAI